MSEAARRSRMMPARPCLLGFLLGVACDGKEGKAVETKYTRMKPQQGLPSHLTHNVLHRILRRVDGRHERGQARQSRIFRKNVQAGRSGLVSVRDFPDLCCRARACRQLIPVRPNKPKTMILSFYETGGEMNIKIQYCPT